MSRLPEVPPVAEFALVFASETAEQALLAAILVNNAVYHRVSGFLLPEHFRSQLHARIYAAMKNLIERDLAANPITLTGAAGRRYLARLATSVVTIIDAEKYGRTILDLYRERRRP